MDQILTCTICRKTPLRIRSAFFVRSKGEFFNIFCSADCRMKADYPSPQEQIHLKQDLIPANLLSSYGFKANSDNLS